jgi:DNA-binding CsgD family transcriptional regulator
MRDRSPRGEKAGIAAATPREAPACLAEFTLKRRKFQLVIYEKGDVRRAAEVARFNLDGAAVAVVENSDSSAAQDIVARLTGRELQIAALVAEGHATKVIAYKLAISEWTVGTHMRRIFAKLNVDNRAAMVYRCAPLIERTATANSGKGRRDPQYRTSLPSDSPRSAGKTRDASLVEV